MMIARLPISVASSQIGLLPPTYAATKSGIWCSSLLAVEQVAPRAPRAQQFEHSCGPRARRRAALVRNTGTGRESTVARHEWPEVPPLMAALGQ
jgi:hypothetical protein